MKALTSSLITATLGSLVLVGCGHGSSGGGGGDVAIVNGEPISMDEYHKYLERKPAVQVNTPQGPAELGVAVPLGFQAMRDLINRRVLLEVAQDEKVMPTAEEVAKELEFQTKQNPQFMQRLTAQGLSLEDIRRDLTLDLAKEKIVTKGVTVTLQDAKDYVDKNPNQFMSPAEARLRLITVDSEAGEKPVDADLAAGKPFAQVASQYSTAPNARATQGLYPITDVSKMQPALQQIIAATPDGRSTDWKPDGGKFVKIFVEQKVTPKKLTMDATRMEYVRRKLAEQRGLQATDLSARLVAKLKMAKIAVTPPELKTLWETAFKDLQKQPQDVQPTTRTGTAGTPAGGPAGAPVPAR